MALAATTIRTRALTAGDLTAGLSRQVALHRTGRLDPLDHYRHAVGDVLQVRRQSAELRAEPV